MLLPIAESIMHCKMMSFCGIMDTSFLLLVTASTINLLSIVLNDAPVLSDDTDTKRSSKDITGRKKSIVKDDIEIKRSFSNEEIDNKTILHLLDSPQCVCFGIFMIWFSSFTIHLGPSFLSGALVAGSERIASVLLATCPLVWGPFRHYVLNLSWVIVNVFCLFLTLFILRRLYTEVEHINPPSDKSEVLISTIIQETPNSVKSSKFPRYSTKMDKNVFHFINGLFYILGTTIFSHIGWTRCY